MSRIFLDQLQTQINTQLADNITGLITPVIMRSVCSNLLDSLHNDEAILTQSVPVTVALTATPTVVPNIFDGSLGGDGDFLKPNIASSYIEGTSIAGFTYWIVAECTIVPGNNVQVDMQAALNGVPYGPIQSVIGTGPSDVASMSVIAVQLSNPSNGQIGVAYSSPGGAVSIDINSSETLVMVVPTDNP
jgi:hypothetical protein